MKHITLSFIAVLCSCLSLFADFSITASAVYLDINGATSFYNTQKTNNQPGISNFNLNPYLGVFGENSGNLRMLGAEIRTIRNNNSSVCSGTLYYTVYPQGNRPTEPEYSSFNLTPFCACNGNTFNSCGGGTCNSIYEQKLQNTSDVIDLTAFDAGTYTLEIYYAASGENCSQQRLDNAGGSNYKADFTISDPLAISISSFGAVCTDNAIKLKWGMQNDIDILKYDIEKSATGLIFSPIGSVNANGSSSISRYTFSDNSPVIGTNYYRMKIYHRNTAISLSSIVRIYYGQVENTVFIYPNPSASALSVRFAAVNKGHYQLSVLGNNGQRIFSMPVDHDGTDKILHITMPTSLSKGLYRMFLIDKAQFYKQAFLIK